MLKDKKTSRIRKGLVAMRGLPVIDSSYRSILKDFVTKYRICPVCLGWGSKYTRKIDAIKNTKVNIANLEDLEKLCEKIAIKKNVLFSDVIRDILEISILGKQECPYCKGKKFLKKRGSPLNKNTQKGKHVGKKQKGKKI